MGLRALVLAAGLANATSFAVVMVRGKMADRTSMTGVTVIHGNIEIHPSQSTAGGTCPAATRQFRAAA